MVLGRLSDEHRHARRLGVASPAPACTPTVRNSLDDAPQVPAGDGPIWRANRYGAKWKSTRPGLGAPRPVCGEAANLRVGKRHSSWSPWRNAAVQPDASRMAAIPDFKSATLTAFLTQNVAPGATVYTDGLESFS